MYLLAKDLLVYLYILGRSNISLEPIILLSLCGNSLIGFSLVGLYSTIPCLFITNSPVYTSSYSVGLLSSCDSLSVRSVTGNILTPVLTTASAGVIGTSAIVVIIVLGSVELYLTLFLFSSIYTKAKITSL